MSLELHKVLLVLSIANSALVRAALEVRIESVTKIFGDNETLFEFNFRLVGRQRLLNGTMIIHVDLDNEYDVSNEDSNIPKSTEACPIKKGEYYARNVEVIADNWVQYTKLGLVRSILVVKKDNVVYGGIDVVLVLSQKIM
ncbi:uncharacterized protein LOC120450915 isoform X2 [Drosophila santomea]|uniref:uncharacterized protein LOC120450915 isoform X2 n=1 Tax=Drosophila santomea TaxID=129105 RepID=UPI001954686C|nr:uncharacterized protein LOC120450915 isoform X2 [Drosophila santomea]